MRERMRGPFLGIYFQDINETVNKNSESEHIRWGTALKGSNDGYWSNQAVASRRKRQQRTERIAQSSPEATSIAIFNQNQNRCSQHGKKEDGDESHQTLMHSDKKEKIIA